MSCAGAGHGQQQGRHHAPPHLHHGTEGQRRGAHEDQEGGCKVLSGWLGAPGCP